MSELSQLQSSLSRILRETLPPSINFENPQAIKELQKINQGLDGIGSVPPIASIEQVVAAYRHSGRIVRFVDLKYSCYGAALPMPDGWCVLHDDKLRARLLLQVEDLEESRKRLRCFQALLSSYFSFARYDEQTLKTAHTGWEILRTWLAQQRTKFQNDGENKKLRLPGWFSILIKHENLLTEKPCDRYGVDILNGDNSSLEEARQGLSISQDSWVMEEIVLSQMKASAHLGDTPFITHLDRLLKIAQGETGVKVSVLLKRRAVAVLVGRYARCASKLEQPVLRDAAVNIIGNPWLKKTAWDAWVKKSDGQPDDEAREMINGWLTQQLLTDFFELLSADGQADQRRLNYWLRFVPAIEGTPWLALGPDALHNNSQAYRDLRERAKGRLLRLENPGASNNNAFIMKMGDWLIVEFGVKGHACYVYPATPTPFSLVTETISLNILKSKNKGESFRHADGHKLWESNFDETICQRVKYWPEKSFSKHNLHTGPSRNSRPNIATSSKIEISNVNFDEVAFWSRITKIGLITKDDRSKGGALWVMIEKNRYPREDQWLETLGFKYKSGRGWWREQG